MSQGVTNGQLANENTFNQGFLSRKDDTDTIGKVDLLNFSTDNLSGTDIVNVQKNINALASSLGISPNQAANLLITWASTVVGASSSNVVAKIEALVAKFHNSTGHAHDGSQGNGAPISALNLTNLNTLEAQWQKISKSAVSGTTNDVSILLTGKVAGGSSSQVGVITSAPDNKCFLVDSSNGTLITDPSDGLTVYGRLDASFILSFYKFVGGVETAYNLPSTDLDILFLEVFTIATRPTIPQFPALFGNLDTTNDVVDATATTPGKVSIAAQTFGGAKTFNDNLKFLAAIYGDSETDSTTTGSNATMPTPTKFVRRVTNASLSSISIITAPTESQFFTLINKTGNPITIVDLDVATGNIRTGTGADSTVAVDGSMLFVYNKTDNRWHVAGGTSAPSANKTLSNLTAPTAVNVDVLPGTDNTRTFGSAILKWLRIYVSKLSSASGDQIDIGVRALLFDTSTTVMSWFNNGIQLAASRVLRFTDGAGTKTIEFNPPATATANQSYTLPLDVPAVDNYALKSTTAGVMSWGPAGAGGGVTNLITNGSADDVSASILVPYQDSSGSRPSDGTGGTTTGITTSVTSTNPIIGTKSYLLSKDAANRQGGGWAIPFTVDLGYRAKSLKISIDYILNSGTFVAGTSTTDSDIIWTIYDVTNSQIIEPSNIKIFSNSTSIASKFEATFQTSSTGSSYRLIAHIATTSTSAYDLKIDNITVSPQVYVYGTPVTDEKDYTVTVSNSTNIGSNRASFMRFGDKIRCTGYIPWVGNGAGSTFTVSLPAGYVIDTTKIQGTIQNQILGEALWLDNGTARKGVSVIYNNTTSVAFEEITSSAGALVGTGFANGDVLSYDFIVPIVGQSSSVQMSEAGDARIVLGVASIAAAATTTNSGIIQFNTVTKDTHGAITTGASWKYTVQVAGDYRVSINMDVNVACNYQVFLNGSSAGYIVSAPVSLYGFGQRTLANLKTGDYIHFVSDTGGTVQATSYMNIERISGPQAIASSEVTYARAQNNAGTSIPNAAFTVVPWPVVDFDSHGGFDGVNKYTVRSAGPINLSALVTITGLGAASANVIVPAIYKNGSLLYRGAMVPIAGSPHAGVMVNVTDVAVAGDYYQVYLFQNSGASKNLETGQTSNHFSVTRGV